MENQTDEAAAAAAAAAMNVGRDYADIMQNLPSELQRHVTAMLECDAQQKMLIMKLRELTNDLRAGNLDTDLMLELLMTGRSLGDRKVEATQRMADVVEGKIRRLAQSSAKYSVAAKVSENGTKAGGGERTESGDGSKERYLPSTSTSAVAAKGPRKLSTDLESDGSNNDARMGNRRLKRTRDCRETDGDEEASAVQHTLTPLPRSTATPQMQSPRMWKKAAQKSETKPKKKVQFKKQLKDIPSSSNNKRQVAFDPKEPTYCICDQISYGEMICCDNDLCPIEWFHFTCVSLQSKPKGKWFCPRCRGDRPNIMKPKAEFLKELVRYNKEKEENA